MHIPIRLCCHPRRGSQLPAWSGPLFLPGTYARPLTILPGGFSAQTRSPLMHQSRHGTRWGSARTVEPTVGTTRSTHPLPHSSPHLPASLAFSFFQHTKLPLISGSTWNILEHSPPRAPLPIQVSPSKGLTQPMPATLSLTSLSSQHLSPPETIQVWQEAPGTRLGDGQSTFLLESGRVTQTPRPPLETPEEDRKRLRFSFREDVISRVSSAWAGPPPHCWDSSQVVRRCLRNPMVHGEAGHRDDFLPDGRSVTHTRSPMKGVCLLSEGRCKWTSLSSEVSSSDRLPPPLHGLRVSIKREADSAPRRQGSPWHPCRASATPHRT